MLATVFGLLVHNVFAGNVTATFPVNFFFWFILGSLSSCVIWHEKRQVKQGASAVANTFDPSPEPVETTLAGRGYETPA
jgi:hypothetical protein